MLPDYTNVSINYDEVIAILNQLAGECESFEEFERRIKEDYEDGLTARIYKHVARQYGKEYLSQIGEDFRCWERFIDYMLDHSAFLNKELKTRSKKYFDRPAFWEKHKNARA